MMKRAGGVATGAGFKDFRTGGQRRGQKSKARDKRKPDWHRDK